MSALVGKLVIFLTTAYGDVDTTMLQLFSRSRRRPLCPTTTTTTTNSSSCLGCILDP